MYIHYQRISIIKFIHYYIIVNGYFGRNSNNLNSVERVYHFTLIFAITKSNEIGSRRLGVCKLYSFTIIDKSLWVQEHKTVHLDFFWNIYFPKHHITKKNHGLYNTYCHIYFMFRFQNRNIKTVCQCFDISD